MTRVTRVNGMTGIARVTRMTGTIGMTRKTRMTEMTGMTRMTWMKRMTRITVNFLIIFKEYDQHCSILLVEFKMTI